LATKVESIPDGKMSRALERRTAKILRDNPLLDRLIEVGTKALRRGLVSGETLRAPRQQLRQHRASAFDLALNFQTLLKFDLIARLFGAIRFFGDAFDSLREPALRPLPLTTTTTSENLYVTRKNLIPARPSLDGKRKRTNLVRVLSVTLVMKGQRGMSVLLWSQTNIA
jgi:ADP-heptose:LPS heptosyltransferase